MRAGALPPPSILDTGDFLTAANLAAAGFGVVLAPRSLSHLALAGIVFREISDYDGSVDLALAWRSDVTEVAERIVNADRAFFSTVRPPP